MYQSGFAAPLPIQKDLWPRGLRNCAHRVGPILATHNLPSSKQRWPRWNPLLVFPRWRAILREMVSGQPAERARSVTRLYRPPLALGDLPVPPAKSSRRLARAQAFLSFSTPFHTCPAPSPVASP